MELYSEESNSQLETEVIEDQKTVSVEELLISCVQARPALWDSRIPIKDRSKTIRDQLWLEIYQELGENPEFSVSFLQKKWRNLRDTFVRLKGEYNPSGSAAKKKGKWMFYDLMSFLNDTINFRPTVTNVDIPSPSTSCTPPLMSPTFSEPETKLKQQPKKIEGAILEALNRINCPLPEASNIPRINPICLRISEILEQVPTQARTKLEIQLLQVAYEGAKDYMT